MLSIIQAAGWPIWPLLICSIAALALIIERFSSLRVIRVAPTRLLDEVISVTRAHLPAPDVVTVSCGALVHGFVDETNKLVLLTGEDISGQRASTRGPARRWRRTAGRRAEPGRACVDDVT